MKIKNFIKFYTGSILFLIIAIIILHFAFVRFCPVLKEYIINFKEMRKMKIEISQMEKQLEVVMQQQDKIEFAKLTNNIVHKTIFYPRSLSLDDESGYSVLFNDIFDMAKSNNIKTYSIQYEYNPKEDSFIASNKGYNVCLLKMKVIGSYLDFEKFLTDMYKYPYFVNISNYEIVPYYKDKNVLLINLDIKVYMKTDETLVK